MMHGDLAVVPIFVNAGAALLPAIAAGFATFFSLLFKPKNLLRACREKPLVPAVIVMIGLAVWAIVHFWPAPQDEVVAGRKRGGSSNAGAASAAVPVYIDWTEVALARIKAKKRGDVAKPAPITSKAAVSAIDAPVIYRGGPRRTGAIGDAPAGKLVMDWDYYPSWVDDDGTVEVEDMAMILSSPVVHGERVFAASCVVDPPDSYGIVFAVDAASGETLWSLDQVDGDEIKGFFSSPAVTADGKFLVIGQGLHPDRNCQLLCINATDGTLRWKVGTELHIESSPAIEDGVVYVGAGAIEDPATHKATSHPGYVMAVRIEDGKELWRYELADPESSPVVKDGIVYIGSGFNGQAVAALRTGTDEALKAAGQSRLLWKTDTPYPITGAVTMLDDSIIVGGGNGDFVFRDPDPAGIVVALDAATGKQRWKADLADAVLGAVAVGKYLICPVAAGKVVALDPATGDEVWATAISGQAPVLAGAAVTGDAVYAVSHDGYLAKLSIDDGELLERTYINAKSRPGEQGLSISSPMISNGRIFVGSETGGLRCYVGE